MEEYYLEKPCNSDEEAVRLLTDKWRLFGGRMNPGLLRHFTGNYMEWLCRAERKYRMICNAA